MALGLYDCVVVAFMVGDVVQYPFHVYFNISELLEVWVRLIST